MRFVTTRILFCLGLNLLSSISFALTIEATGTEGVDQSYDQATNTTTFSANTTNAIIHPLTIANKLLSTNVVLKDPIDPNVSLSNNTDITWNTGNYLIINAKQNIIFGNQAQIISQNTGNLVLRADQTGDNEGTVVPPISTGYMAQMTGGGSIRIYYRPKSFDNPTDFSRYLRLTTPGTALAYMAINTPTDLIRMNWNLGGNYALARNIDAKDLQDFLPIGTGQYPFAGKFDGQGFAISNLTISLPTLDNVGLFGRVNGFGSGSSTLENIHLLNINIEGRSFVGGLVGQASDTVIFNAHVAGKIKGSTGAHGVLVGAGTPRVYIGQCYVEGSVTSDNTTSAAAEGGISAGVNSWGMDNSYSLAAVTGGSVGGLISSPDTIRIRNSFAAGPVQGTDKGGLFSRVYAVSNTSLYWDKQTTGQNFPVNGIPIFPGALGYDTAQMYRKATYLDWDFDTIWGIDEGRGYPYLQWSRKPAPWTYMFNAKKGVRKLVI